MAVGPPLGSGTGPGGGGGNGLPQAGHPTTLQSNNSPPQQQNEPSPEKPVTSARTPTERKRKRKNTNNQHNSSPRPASQTNLGGALAGAPNVPANAEVGNPNPASINSGGSNLGPGGDMSAKGAGKKINDYFKHTPSSPVRTGGLNPSGAKSPLPFPPAPGLYPPSPKAQYVGSPSPGAPVSGGGIPGAQVGSGPGTGSGSGSSILETALGGGFDSLVDPIVDALIGRRRKK